MINIMIHMFRIFSPSPCSFEALCRATLGFQGAQAVARHRDHHIEGIGRPAAQLEGTKATHGISVRDPEL